VGVGIPLETAPRFTELKSRSIAPADFIKTDEMIFMP
jgi:hypothetical protein